MLKKHLQRTNLLGGAPFHIAVKILINNRFNISLIYFPRLGVALLVSILLYPLYLTELLIHSRRIRKTNIIKSPVFIIGHWRTGTTLLHNLMSTDSHFGFPTTFQCSLPGIFITGNIFKSWFGVFLAPTRPMDKVQMRPDLPQEDELALCLLSGNSYYQSLFFPSNFKDHFEYYAILNEVTSGPWSKNYLYLLKKLTYYHQGKQLLLKNPVNTLRIKHLLKLFPEAKFIYISRRKEDVISSTIKLSSTFMPLYTLQVYDPKNNHLDSEIIYERTLSEYETQKKLIPVESLVEITYENLVNSPISELKIIYDKLGFKWEIGLEKKIIRKMSRSLIK